MFEVRIPWSLKIMPWHEICVKVVEVFGLPGDRFVYATAANYMIFKFNSEKDYKLCQILLSEYIDK